jgi:hypothetical protein
VAVEFWVEFAYIPQVLREFDLHPSCNQLMNWERVAHCVSPTEIYISRPLPLIVHALIKLRIRHRVISVLPSVVEVHNHSSPGLRMNKKKANRGRAQDTVTLRFVIEILRADI